MGYRTWLSLQSDRAAAVACAVVAMLAMVIGWLRVSGTPYPAEQLPYLLSAGLGGLFLMGVAATLWLSADLRDEWGELAAIDDTLHQLITDPAFHPSSVIEPAHPVEPSGL